MAPKNSYTGADSPAMADPSSDPPDRRGRVPAGVRGARRRLRGRRVVHPDIRLAPGAYVELLAAQRLGDGPGPGDALLADAQHFLDHGGLDDLLDERTSSPTVSNGRGHAIVRRREPSPPVDSRRA